MFSWPTPELKISSQIELKRQIIHVPNSEGMTGQEYDQDGASKKEAPSILISNLAIPGFD